jgi:hypothetical protein
MLEQQEGRSFCSRHISNVVLKVQDMVHSNTGNISCCFSLLLSPIKYEGVRVFGDTPRALHVILVS